MLNVIQKDDEQIIKKGKTKKVRGVALTCKFPGICNRFDIQPGYRWDGVDRGNGFENKFFKSQNQAIDK